MRSFAVWLETTRSADAPGTRKVVFPGRGLHHASPTGPWPPGSDPICPGCGLLPEAILRCPRQEECPYCPQFSTPSRIWGPPNSVPRSYTRFYTSGSGLTHARSWSFFSSFWAGKSPRLAKIACIVVHHRHRVSRHNKTKQKILKGGIKVW
jgi:hypothetical protein